MRAFLALIGRELRLAFRQGADAVTALLFFVLATVMFPLGIGPDLAILAWIATGLLWVTALLAALLSLERLYLADYEDGTLDLLSLAPLPLEMVALAKIIAHWLTTGLPLLVIAPVLATFLGMGEHGLPMLVAALALGTPTLSLVGSVCAALTLGARRGGVLLPILVLPLYIPVLVFGTAAVSATLDGMDPSAPLMILGGLLLGSLVLAPWASAAGLRQSLS
jgi:heme exporter protein B